MVAALDLFIADALKDHATDLARGDEPAEMCGAFILRHIEPVMSPEAGIEWLTEVEYVRLMNVASDPRAAFVVSQGEIGKLIEQEIQSVMQISQRYSTTRSAIIPATVLPSAEEIFAAAFSPLVGIVHSHPGGSTEVSSADFSMSETATAWRRATAPASILGKEDDAKFYESDYLLAIHDNRGEATLVNWRKGSVRGTWKGNFRGAID